VVGCGKFADVASFGILLRHRITYKFSFFERANSDLSGLSSKENMFIAWGPKVDPPPCRKDL
jgi:hypothetical protein